MTTPLVHLLEAIRDNRGLNTIRKLAEQVDAEALAGREGEISDAMLGVAAHIRMIAKMPGTETHHGSQYAQGMRRAANMIDESASHWNKATPSRAGGGEVGAIETAPFYWERGGGAKQDAATGYCNGWNDCVAANRRKI